MTQLIRSVDGDTLSVTKDKLTEVKKADGDTTLWFAYLRDMSKGTVRITIYRADTPSHDPCHYISMNWADRHIGCQYFTRDTFRIITRAIKAALNGGDIFAIAKGEFFQ